MKTNKITVDLNTIRRLVTLSPGITVLEAIELVKAAKVFKDKLGIDIINKAGGDRV